MVRRRAQIALAIVSMLAVAGCGSAAVASVQPTPSPTVGVTPIPTPRPTPRPVRTAPPTPRPSATPVPTPVVVTPEGNAAREGFVAFAGNERIPFHLVLTSRVEVLAEPVTIRLVLDTSDGDMAGQIATKAVDVTDTADLVIVGGRQFVRLSARSGRAVGRSGERQPARRGAAGQGGPWPAMDASARQGAPSPPGRRSMQSSVAYALPAPLASARPPCRAPAAGGTTGWPTVVGARRRATFRILGTATARDQQTDLAVVGTLRVLRRAAEARHRSVRRPTG